MRPTSVQPVNRFSWFHVDSPWRSSTILFMLGLDGERQTNGADARKPAASRAKAVIRSRIARGDGVSRA